MITRIKKIWKLSQKPVEVIDELSVKQIDSLPDEVPNVKAEFFGEGTIEELTQLQREDAGTAPWYKRIGL